MDNAMNNKACSFTGHRTIEPSHISRLEPLVARAIAFAYKEGCRRFYCGGAVGFDTIAARQVIQFRIAHPDCELHLLIPCRNQSERWSERQRDMYEYTLAARALPQGLSGLTNKRQGKIP